MSDPKSCSTCEHRHGSKCRLTGFYIETERKYPSGCGVKYEGWVPRLGVMQRLRAWFYGVKP